MPQKPISHAQDIGRGREQGPIADARYNARRRSDAVLGPVQRIRSSARWQRVREQKLRHDALCQDCLARGRTEAATQVDHVIPLAQRPDLALELSNLRSLCTRCHARKSQVERGRAVGSNAVITTCAPVRTPGGAPRPGGA